MGTSGTSIKTASAHLTISPSLVSASSSATPVHPLPRMQGNSAIALQYSTMYTLVFLLMDAALPDPVTVAAGVGGALFIPIAVAIALLILCIHWKMRQRKRQLEFIREVLII